MSSVRFPARPRHPAVGSERKFAFERLPDTPQSLICSSASTPSCPTHALLACVCKNWGAEATRHLEHNGTNIVVDTSCRPGCPLWVVERQVERIFGVADELRSRGQHVKELTLFGSGHGMGDAEATAAVQEALQVMPSILDALAAAGRRPGGLKLQQLQLPVFGSASMFAITRALSGCHQLQRLSLMDSCSGQSTWASAEVRSKLPAALQQLTQLTSLKLQCGLFEYYSKPITQGQGLNQELHLGGINTVDLDGLLESLPRSLVALSLEDYHQKHGRRSYTLSDGSLCHLVALQRLTLPADTRVWCNPGGSSSDTAGAASSSSSSRRRSSSSTEEEEGGSGCNHLAQLTAVTYLACGTALREEGWPLLALPNLVELRTGHVQLQLLEELAGKTSLRSLGCLLSLSRCRSQVAFLMELTQLTGLGVALRQGVTDWRLGLVPVGDASEAGGLLTATLLGMPGLRKLRLESGLLLRMDVRALTALTSLAVLSSRPGEFAGDGSLLCQVMQHLQPLHGRLQGGIDIGAWQGSSGDILGPA